MLNFNELKAGTYLPEIHKVITQKVIDRYAEASQDFNPIHVNPAFAAKTPLGGTIAHGMLSLSYISQMMTETFRHHWTSAGRLNVRFKNPARPGDILSIKGKITNVNAINEDKEFFCEIVCTNQNNQPVVLGEAHVRVPVR